MPTVHQLPCGKRRVAAGGDTAMSRPCTKHLDLAAVGLKRSMVISNFIEGRGWRLLERRYPDSRDISDESEGLQEPNQHYHEHDYVEQTLDSTGHRNIGID